MKEKGNGTNIPRVTIIYKANEVGRRGWKRTGNRIP